ncbi:MULTISPECIES: twin-arginine translocation signal domain-containing protein [unclassified Sphingobium]|uniref:twin-arginine translocation signal domain-containing protein n=1 Tax=unclassified Sphingobium TaxID=2611147 RepID=UPI00222463A3|nr:MULTISPECIES: twin-arginine translocation signal domain-containing protein [unclassified Sphingobium]MCW2412193.1 hypothetical protein [Sphingobium sp. B8D3D]MCW2415510.1 hypothetical protein [Sphingobium sp. B8D3A]
MSGVSRRQLLGGAAVAGAVGLFGARAVAGPEKAARIVVYDSRRAASRSFAGQFFGLQQIDLAGEHSRNWAGVRAIRRSGAMSGPVAGLTGWNDYVAARTWLEDRGLRLRSERRDATHELIAWTMA